MRLKITHRFEYQSDPTAPYALQRLRLVPTSSALQKVRVWTLAIEGAREEVRFSDHFGNDTRLISIEGGPHAVSIEAAGEVETVNRSGVAGFHRGFAPLWLFQRETALTVAGAGIEALAKGVKGADIGRLHDLMATVHERVSAVPGAGPAVASAEDVLAKGSGVPADQAHIFIATARLLGYPARYVSGYCLFDGDGEQAASHAWAEAHVEGLGWVGFDVANKICPEENYVRVATGRDQRDAQAISGILAGQGAEQLAVRISVEQ
jgi:transglutaminase-like putative cysteine protease